MRKEFGAHTFIKKPTENLVGDYMISKRRMKCTIGVKSSCDDVQVRINTELRSLQMDNERLAKTKAIHCEKRRNLQRDMDHVKELLSQIREGHIAFEDFIKNNQEKRERVQKNVQGRVAVQQIQLDELKKDMNTWANMKRTYAQQLRQTKFYEHFLDGVVAVSAGEFKDCDAIVRRYTAISEARKICNKKLTDNVRKTEEILRNLKNRAYKMETLVLKNRVCALNKQYSLAHGQALLWDDIVQRVQNAVINCHKEKEQISETCWHLYILMCHRQNDGVNIPRPDISEQMTSIKYSLLKGAKILAQVKNS